MLELSRHIGDNTDVPAGDIAIKNVADLYLYPNTVQAVLINGAQVKDWLEMSAGMFNTVKAGSKDAPLLSSDFPARDSRGGPGIRLAGHCMQSVVVCFEHV